MMKRLYYHGGMTLTEILVVLFISSMLMTVVLSLYSAMRRHYDNLENSLNDSMDKQNLVHLIRENIREAGFTPCIGLNHLKSIDTRNYISDLKAMSFNLSPNSGLKVNRMSSEFSEVLQQTSANKLRLTNETKFSMQRPIIIADCYHAEIHTLKSIQKRSDCQEIELIAPLAFDYELPAYVGEWIEASFFVKKTQSTLYYKRGHTDALSDRVEDITVNQHNRLVTVILSFKNNENQQLETLMRIP